MNGATFPESPGQARALRRAAIELVVRRAPLASIHEVLSISIHDVVNDHELKRLVLDFYRISRWIENDAWLRRQVQHLP